MGLEREKANILAGRITYPIAQYTGVEKTGTNRNFNYFFYFYLEVKVKG
jgi:hypothetical protein